MSSYEDKHFFGVFLCSKFWANQCRFSVDFAVGTGEVLRRMGPMKKLVKKTKGPKTHKKPAANLDFSGLPTQGMSLDDKMEQWHKSKNQDINSFLDTLTKGQRECLWQRFSSARSACKDPEQDQVWNLHCKGKGSDENKKKMLKKNKLFLDCSGDLKNSQVYQKEMMSLSRTSGSKEQEEWVPLAVILRRRGLHETMRRVKRGSIRCRRDPKDKEEWQFCMETMTSYSQTEMHHKHEMSQGGKSEAAQWIQMKGMALLESGQNTEGEDALAALLPGQAVKKNKQNALALMDKDDSEEGAEGNKSSGSGVKKDEHEVEAELLSEVGGKMGKDEASKRLKKMASLVKKVKKDIAPAKGKALEGTLSKLEKLPPKKSISLESCKNELFEAAHAIKKAKRL